MRILFPSQPFEERSVDHAFEAERAAAIRAGFETSLLDSDALDAKDFDRAVRRLPEVRGEEPLVYRGWMLRSEDYERLFGALRRRGYLLVHDPDQYARAHHLPGWYDVLREFTPRTVWTTTGPAVDADALAALLEPFGDSSLVLKDFVKSQKHSWEEACFIPSARDRQAVVRVASRFAELQGDGLVGGLVFREFVELAPLAAHSKSGMPLTEEYRAFVLDGEVVATGEYWEEGSYGDVAPDLASILDAVKRVGTRFVTVDVARTAHDTWIVMEIGDAQVSGIPERLGVDRFYRALADRFAR